MLEVFSFLKKERPAKYPIPDPENTAVLPPRVKLVTDRLAYRPGDTLFASIEVSRDDKCPSSELISVEKLIIGINGIEKLDPQWLLTTETARGSRQRRGERVILEALPTAIVSNLILQQGVKRTYVVRTTLPKVLPPSYKGTVVRYLYYIMVNVQWSVGHIENGHSEHHSLKDGLPPVEIRSVLNVWAMPNNSGLTAEEPSWKDYAGIVPQLAIQVEIYWKEKNDENDWTRVSDALSEIEDDIISQSTESALHSPEKSFSTPFSRAVQLESSTEFLAGASKNALLQKPSISGFGSLKKPPLLIIPNSSDDGIEESWTDNNGTFTGNNMNEDFGNGNHDQDVANMLCRSPSGAYTSRGRSYNIKFDNQVLARFSPRNPDSTYYFGDVVGGVLTFFHDEGSRRCLEISAVLETREVLNAAFIHPSRKNSPVITRIQADYHEVVADMLQTHFVFSIPFDGPPSFATPHISVEWVLRFEFITAARDVDWSDYEHPLLIKEREQGEWAIPILVHAPLPRTRKAKLRREVSSTPRKDTWGGASDGSRKIPPLFLPPSREKHLSRDNLASLSLASI